MNDKLGSLGKNPVAENLYAVMYAVPDLIDFTTYFTVLASR